MKQLIRHILREHTREIGEANPKKLTTDEFIKRAQEVHGGKYDYSKSDYKGKDVKLTIICPTHGEFQQTPAAHIRQKQNCPKCVNNNIKKTTQQFIDDAKLVHGDEYTYDNVDYKGARKKVAITCPIHGDFFQEPSNHLNGFGCPKCSGNHKRNTEDFIMDAKSIHPDKYDYSKTDVVNNLTKVTITCPVHGDFLQTPKKHLMGQGCPKCRESKGERILSQFFDSNGINYERQKSFDDCIKTNKTASGKFCYKLPFDFYLPKYNSCVEYDGEQHFRAVSYWGGEEGFKNQQKRDKIKNQYCKKNGIKLIRIPYTMKTEEIEPYILKELGIK
jgi:Zn finger protein HypA/HybF involved in hydrogenase expression